MKRAFFLRLLFVWIPLFATLAVPATTASAQCVPNLTVPLYDGQTTLDGCDVQVNGVVVPEPGGATAIFKSTRLPDHVKRTASATTLPLASLVSST